MTFTHENINTSFLGRFRNYFLTGILVTAPVSLSLYVVWSLIYYIDSSIKQMMPPLLRGYWLFAKVPGLGILVVMITLTIIGALMAGFVGRAFFRFGERIVERMPLVRGIYGATKQVLETMLSPKGNSFDRVVLVQYPHPGTWSLGFVTGDALKSIDRVTKQEMVNVFVPTTPLPTQGFLLFVPLNDIKPLDMSVEQGLKLLVSIGMVHSQNTPPTPD